MVWVGGVGMNFAPGILPGLGKVDLGSLEEYKGFRD